MSVSAKIVNSDEVNESADTLHLLLKLANRLAAPFSTHLSSRHNISMNEFRMLMAIGRLGPCAGHQLAEYTGVTAMSVSRAVATLERHGRIEVSRDSDNRRRKWLKLTEEGERLFAIMQPQGERVADYLFSDLSGQEVEHLQALVERLIATLEATDEQGNSLFLEKTRPDDREERA